MVRLFIACVLGTASRAQAADLELATLAPRDSAWGKVFKAWAKAVDTESNGALRLTWYWNGVQGDEAAMIGKIRSKQLDGGAFTAAGLTRIYPSVIAYQMPGLFTGWAKLDSARGATRTKLDAAFDAAGFRILGTGDVGVAHYMSRGRPIRTPGDLQRMHPFFVSGDVINQEVLEAAGVASPRPLAVPAILPALAARARGAVDVVNTPSIAAEQLQWSAHVDHVSTMPTTYTIGALVIDKHAYDALPADARAIIDRTGANTGRVLTERIRAMDQGAFNRMKATKTVVEPTPAERAEWSDLWARVRASLRNEGKVGADFFDDVVNAAR
jgi:TRAP-type C4-dicarboxylate transport system substrate-binding protein